MQRIKSEDVKVQEADRNAWCCRVPESEDQHMRKAREESLFKGATVHKESDHFYPEAQLMKESEVEVEDEDGSEGEEGKPL